MRINKKIISIILSLFFVLSCVPYAMAANDDYEWDAVGILGSKTSFQNMAAAAEVVGSVGQIEEKDGRDGWRMTSNSWYYNSIFIDVKGLRRSAGKNVLVEVDYYDEGTKGWFMLEYNSRDKSGILTEEVHTTGTNTWKTAQFTLYAPTMSNDVAASQHSGDFAITTERMGNGSVDDVIIGAIRVKVLDDIKAADVDIEFTKQPKNYYDNEQFEFDLKVKDKIGGSYTANMTYRMVNSYGETVAVYNDTIDLKPFEIVKKRVTLDFNCYGRHTLFVEGRCEEWGYYFEDHEDFAYIKKSRFDNERFGVCNHFAWNRPYCDPDIIYPMMVNAGIKWSRDEIKWADYEKQPKVFKLPAWANSFIDKANQTGREVLLVLYGGNRLYGNVPSRDAITLTYTKSPEWYAAFEDYAYHLVKDMGDRVTNYEYWNEWGWGGVDHEEYINLAKATYNGVKRGNPNANTVGICNAGTGVAIIKTSFDMGAEEYMDDVSYHIYPNGAPEIHDVYADSKSVRDVLNTYKTGANKNIWLTEFGWNNFTYSYNESGENLAKACAMQYETSLVDKLFWYDFTDDNANYDSTGSTYGMVENFNISMQNRYLAKPAYIAAANVNDLLGTPEFQSKLRLNDDKAYAYHYRRTQDGEDVAVLWSTEENTLVTMNFGTESIEVCDHFGNPINVMGSDGTYSFTLGSAPIFVTGNFGKFEESKAQIYISETKLTVPEEDIASVRFYKTTDKKADIAVNLPESSDNIEILNTPIFDGKVAELKMKVSGHVGEKDNVPIKITFEDGTVCYDGKILIEYVKAFDISGRTRLYSSADTRRWMLDLDIYSNFRSGDTDAYLDITYPEVLKKSNIKLGRLKPGQNNVSVHLNEIAGLSNYEMQGVIRTKNGYSQQISFAVDFGLGFKVNKPPVIDGKFSEGEWRASAKLISNRQDQIYLLLKDQPWRGVTDLSAESYVQWDEENLYFASIVTDDVHFNDQDGALIWQGDSIQLGFRFDTEQKQGQDNSLFTEIGIAMGKDGKPVFHSYRKETGIEGNFENCEVVVTRSGDQTIYELRCPWTDITPKGTEIYEDMELRYAMIVNDNDGKGRRGWAQFGGGIAPSKDVTKYARVRLMP